MKRQNLYTESGTPKRIRCYMYKQIPAPYADYITVIYTHVDKIGYKGKTLLRGMSGRPFHPLGISYFDELDSWKCKQSFGSKIDFEDLPADCKTQVLSDYKDLWENQ